MFFRKKEFRKLQERVERLERGELNINTSMYGNRSVRWYIRMICEKIKRDPKNELRSLDD